MSFQSPYPGQPVPPGPSVPSGPEPRERVALGLLLAVVAVLGGMVLAVVIARLGFIAAISSFAIAFGAAALYEIGAGRPARKGIGPLVLLIILGVVASYFAVVASDLWDAYSDIGLTQQSRTSFVREYLFSSGDVFQDPYKDLPFFAIFALLGVFGVIRRLVATR